MDEKDNVVEPKIFVKVTSNVNHDKIIDLINKGYGEQEALNL